MDKDADHRDYQGGGYGGDRAHDGRRRIPGKRPVTDYGTSMVQWMLNRQPRYKGGVILEAERPSPSYIVDMLPPPARPQKAVDTIPAKHLHASQNRLKHPINVVLWTPEGRRVLTCSSDGEFTLWNGMAFNFETILRAHDSAIRAAVYSHSEEWLISADHEGLVKFWQPNFNNVRHIQAHEDPIRDLAFSPNDEKYVTACDDTTLKIYNFAADRAESQLRGHNWDVKTVDWHPTKGLLVSGSKDHQVKLWDPRSGRCLTTLRGHKNTISKTSFDPHRGHLLATCARDQVARVFDIRMMRDVVLLRGFEHRQQESQPMDRMEKKDQPSPSTLTWHPVHPSLLSIGGNHGFIYHYLLDEPNTPPGTATTISPYDSSDPSNAPAQTIYPAHKIPHAHQWAVWSLSWHPLGHILASGSNDRITRFWTRPRPGETECYNDIFHVDAKQAEAHGTYDRRRGRQEMLEAEEQELEDEADGLVDQTMPAKQSALPGLPGLTAGPNGPSGPGPLPGALGASAIALPDNGYPPHPPPPFPPPPGGFPPFDPEQMRTLMGDRNLVIPPPLPPPPPPPRHGIAPPPPGFDMSKLPPEFLAKLPFPGAFPPPPIPPMPAGAVPNINPRPDVSAMAGTTRPGNFEAGSLAAGNSAARKRAPLPSQRESLLEEQRRGNFRKAR